jgi:hypothetical protein
MRLSEIAQEEAMTKEELWEIEFKEWEKSVKAGSDQFPIYRPTPKDAYLTACRKYDREEYIKELEGGIKRHKENCRDLPYPADEELYELIKKDYE